MSAGFFEVIGVAPRQGRVFTAADGADAPKVAVVNEEFQRRHYPDGALGPPGADLQRHEHRLAHHRRGRAGYPRHRSRRVDAPARVLSAAAAEQRDDERAAPSATASRPALAGGMRQAVTAMDRNLPIYNVRTLQKTIDDNTWGWRIFGTLFSLFGVAALFLATVGLYGVMAFSVSRRTQEIGVRMAVGAGAPDVLRMVLRQGAWQVGAGVALGPRPRRGARQRDAADVLPSEPVRRPRPSWPWACCCWSPVWPRPSCRRAGRHGSIRWRRFVFSDAQRRQALGARGWGLACTTVTLSTDALQSRACASPWKSWRCAA